MMIALAITLIAKMLSGIPFLHRCKKQCEREYFPHRWRSCLMWTEQKQNPVFSPSSVVDPGFPRGGVPTGKMGAPAYYFSQFPPKNCMKMKHFGPREGGTKNARPSWIRQWSFLIIVKFFVGGGRMLFEFTTIHTDLPARNIRRIYYSFI